MKIRPKGWKIGSINVIVLLMIMVKRKFSGFLHEGDLPFLTLIVLTPPSLFFSRRPSTNLFIFSARICPPN
ncbi:MAG: hypothetical protein ACQ9MH_27540 [Nitrospinales bacterium]